MPELPEIETVKLQLGKALIGKTIEKIEVLSPRSFGGDKKQMEGKVIEGVRRRAKVLMIDTNDNRTIAFHFKMTGQLILDRDADGKTYSDRIVGGHPTEDFVGRLPSAHTRVIFYLDDGKLFFNDQRLFGWVKVGDSQEIAKMKFLQELGPEALEITLDDFKKRVGKFKRAIKLVLMEQKVISGIGNIYANDGLWDAEIMPNRLANSLSMQELERIFGGVQKVLKEGIRFGGATAADAKYINLHGLGGHYQEHFRTYDREGMACLRNDGGVIRKIVLGGRGTFYCPVCQK